MLPFDVSQLQKTKSRTDDHCRDIGATSMALATHQQQTETDMEVRMLLNSGSKPSTFELHSTYYGSFLPLYEWYL